MASPRARCSTCAAEAVAGAHTYAFPGRLNGHKLAPARYILTVTAVGAKHGPPVSAPFTIAR
jgi:hypothetical protein